MQQLKSLESLPETSTLGALYNQIARVGEYVREKNAPPRHRPSSSHSNEVSADFPDQELEAIIKLDRGNFKFVIEAVS